MSYTLFAAACTEVEIDVLTGEHAIRRTDIFFDCGRSLNPMIDMGQVQPDHPSRCHLMVVCQRQSAQWDFVVVEHAPCQYSGSTSHSHCVLSHLTVCTSSGCCEVSTGIVASGKFCHVLP